MDGAQNGCVHRMAGRRIDGAQNGCVRGAQNGGCEG